MWFMMGLLLGEMLLGMNWLLIGLELVGWGCEGWDCEWMLEGSELVLFMASMELAWPGPLASSGLYPLVLGVL